MTGTSYTNPHAATDATLDQWTKEVIDVHFDPNSGTPYWTEWAAENDVDVRNRVDGFADLEAVFGPFDEDILREIPAAKFAPQSLEGNRRVYETGGTTGSPKRVLMCEYWRDQARWMARLLEEWSFPTGNVLGLSPPGGVNNAGTFVQHLAHEWDALPYHVTMDPRWTKHISTRPDDREFNRYVEHLLEQAANVLETQPITVLFTTGRLLERPAVRELITNSGLEGIIHGGTALNRDTHRVFREEWYDDLALVGEYGNTLMGIAPEAPPSDRAFEERSYHLDYVPCYPYFVPEIVDETGSSVAYDERGRIRLTVLTNELFLPFLLERDSAIRIEGSSGLPWDWVRTPRTADTEQSGAVEGVY